MGHSHTRAIAAAARDFPRPGLTFELLSLLEGRYWDESSIRLDTIREDAVAVPDVDYVVLIPWGNEPNALGLVAGERPFDFIMPGEEACELLPGHEVVPVGLVRCTLERMTVPGLYEALTGLFNCPVFVLSTPPPIEDADYIVNHPGTARQMIEGRRINNAALRLKIWRLYCEITRNRCAKAGFNFVDVAPENFGAGGFLSDRALAGDATHGNSWYGENMIEHLLEEIRSYA